MSADATIQTRPGVSAVTRPLGPTWAVTLLLLTQLDAGPGSSPVALVTWAWSCAVSPARTLGRNGPMVMAGRTRRVACPVTPPIVAVTVVLPMRFPTTVVADEYPATVSALLRKGP